MVTLEAEFGVIMADPIEAYLEQHQVSTMLDQVVNRLVRDMPEQPIDGLINGLLEEAAATPVTRPTYFMQSSNKHDEKNEKQ